MAAEQIQSSKTIQSNFYKGIVALSLGHLGRRVFSIFGNLYLLNLLNPEAMGKFVILQFVTLQIPNLVGIGLNKAMIQSGAGGSIHIKQSSFTLQIIASMAFTLFVWMNMHWIYRFYHYDAFIYEYLPCMLLLAPLLVYKQFIVSELEINLAFPQIAKSDLIEHVVYLSISIAMCYFYSPLSALCIGYILGVSLSTAYLSLRFTSWRILQPRFHWKELKSYIHFGSYVQLGNIFNLVTNSMFPLLLPRLAGTESLGMVTWAMRIAWSPQSITNYIDNISFATFCRLRSSQRRYRWILSNLTQSVVTFTGFYLLILNLFFPELLQLFLGMQWVGTRTMVLCFSSYVLFYSAGTVVVQSIFASDKAKFLCKLAFGLMLSTWTIGLASVYLDGARGYGFYYLLLNFYSAIIYWKAKQYSSFKYKDSLLKPFAAIAITASLFICYRAIFPYNGISIMKFTLEIFSVSLLFIALNYFFWARLLLLSIPRQWKRSKAKIHPYKAKETNFQKIKSKAS